MRRPFPVTMAAGVSLRNSLKRWPAAQAVNAYVQGHLQQASASWGQWRYDRMARQRRIAQPDETALRSALLARLAPRRAGRPPAGKGEMHVFLTFGLTNWEAVLPRALAPFGRVTTF